MVLYYFENECLQVKSIFLRFHLSFPLLRSFFKRWVKSKVNKEMDISIIKGQAKKKIRKCIPSVEYMYYVVLLGWLENRFLSLVRVVKIKGQNTVFFKTGSDPLYLAIQGSLIKEY